jgi:probable HAF family extracellular repeat protein
LAMDDLGTLGGSSSANDINNKGQIVGLFYNADISTWHAFLFENSTMTDLNDLIAPLSGWVLEDARSINEVGQIVGYGTNSNGYGRAFLLTPIPEPSTLSLLSIIFIGIHIYVRRKKSFNDM